ncbi:MAG: sensor histidine kinase, partial [Parafilimonas sp.]
MSIYAPTRREWRSFFILMPVIDIITLYIMYGESIWMRYDAFAVVFCINFLIGTATFWLNVIVMHEIQLALPDLKQTVKRVAFIVGAHIIIAIAVYTLVFNVYDAFSLFGFKKDLQQLNLSIWIVIALVMLSDTLWESDFIYKKYKESIIEKEEMQQLNIQQEFDALKSQVNPHFLFNCFNTLSSLINEDRPQAEVFLNELSKVYRYLLRNNEDSLSTLKDELNFIQSFYKLLKTRHGDAIELQVEVDRKYYNYLLPSLSLQLLVENAVKHGASLAEMGGVVRLSCALEDDKLRLGVYDNGPGFPAGFSLTNSNGHGLRNVAERLRGYYGEAAHLRWESSPGSTQVWITAPT